MREIQAILTNGSGLMELIKSPQRAHGKAIIMCDSDEEAAYLFWKLVMAVPKELVHRAYKTSRRVEFTNGLKLLFGVKVGEPE